jgi:hypothetical protein
MKADKITIQCLECKQLNDEHARTCSEYSDDVERPAHYVAGKIEAIDVMEAFDLDRCGLLFNAAKYLFRAGSKCPADESTDLAELRDLKKCAWYLSRKIKRLEEKTGEGKGK